MEGSAEDEEVQAMAERIVDYARMCMANQKRVSPFERAAAREGMYFRGGVSFKPLIIAARSLKMDSACGVCTESGRVSINCFSMSINWLTTCTV